jgi:hypothetical protein
MWRAKALKSSWANKCRRLGWELEAGVVPAIGTVCRRLDRIARRASGHPYRRYKILEAKFLLEECCREVRKTSRLLNPVHPRSYRPPV